MESHAIHKTSDVNEHDDGSFKLYLSANDISKEQTIFSERTIEDCERFIDTNSENCNDSESEKCSDFCSKLQQKNVSDLLPPNTSVVSSSDNLSKTDKNFVTSRGEQISNNSSVDVEMKDLIVESSYPSGSESRDISHPEPEKHNLSKKSEDTNKDIPGTSAPSIIKDCSDQNQSSGRTLRSRKKEKDREGHRGSDANNSALQDHQERTKSRKILQVLRSATPDRESLKQQAISRGGLVSNGLRKLAWPVLLGVDVSDIPVKPDTATLHEHRDYEQVVLDVNRSLKRFPPGMDEAERMSMQDQLVDCIMRVLCARPELHYYQGYHDIVVTFLLVVGEDVTFALMNQLSIQHLRDFMYENMDKTTGMLHYLYPLLGKTNPELRAFMEKAEVGTIFSLPWLITWYGHVLGDIRHIVRLYDFFIACHPLMPIYLAAAIVLYRGEEILGSEQEMPIIHCLLSRIPPDLPIEKLIQEAGDLFLLHPPNSVEKEANVQYQLYLEENERKKKQLQQLTLARQRRSRTYWPLIGRKSQSVLVKVTVWTGAALLSAAAFTIISSAYMKASFDGGFDFHWLWGS